MSDNIIEPTTLENFPVEIFHVIFEYIPNFWDVYTSFFGLNRRIDSIVENVSAISLSLDKREHYTHPMVASIALRVTKLIVNHDWPLNLASFINIRALKIKHYYNGWWTDGRNLSVSLPNLEYLFIEVVPKWSPGTLRQIIFTEMASIIFSNNKPFPKLRVCNLQNNFIPERDIWTTSVPSLRSLTTGTQDSATYYSILAFCPSLERLTLKMVVPQLDDNQLSKIFAEGQHLLLRRLTLKIRHKLTDIENIGIMLSVVPNLTHLIILYDGSTWRRSWDASVETFLRLAENLVQRLPRLHHFDMWLLLTIERFNAIGSSIRRGHSLFAYTRMTRYGETLIISNKLP